MIQLSYSELTKRLYFLPVKGKKVDITDDVEEFIKFKKEQETGDKQEEQDELWSEVLKFGNSIYTNAEWFSTMKSKYHITRKQQ